MNILSSLGRKVDATTSMLAGDLKKLAEAYPVSSLVGRSEQIEFFEELPLLPNGMSLVPTPGHDRAFDNLNRQYLENDSFLV